MLTDRRQKVLNALVDEYVASAAPVASRRLAQTYLTDISSATIRSELMGLEADGFARSPHTSAGRMPTNLGFRMFVNGLLLTRLARGHAASSTVSATNRQVAVHPVGSREVAAPDLEERSGIALDALSEATGLLAVLWLTSPERTVQQRGLSRLLAQPEFHDAQALVPLMELLERSQALGFLLENALYQTRFRVLVGIGEADGPLSPFSLIAERLATYHHTGVIAVFGPTRMDYRTVIQAVSLAVRSIGTMSAGS
ncbi:MAG: hypothetical protein LBI64_04705 [Coriobacteriales bacterium]|jgi:transcriptional regulator of heat shock response|nr:hypothetical protein [Coriobacteriales bacterium]